MVGYSGIGKLYTHLTLHPYAGILETVLILDLGSGT